VDNNSRKSPNVDEPTPKRSRSELKIQMPYRNSMSLCSDSGNDSYIIIDIEILNEILSKRALCSRCKVGSLQTERQNQCGAVCKVQIKCSNIHCRASSSFFTSKRAKPVSNKYSQGPKPFALNVRSVLGMRFIGKGLRAMNFFLSTLNASPGITQESYENILCLIEEKSHELAQNSMNNAAIDIREHLGKTADEFADTTCMFDGTWQRRGHSSLIGAVVCISAHNYQVIDVEVMRKNCKICQRLEKMDQTSNDYKDIKEKHKCSKNYEGSSGHMEVVGTQRIFGRSIKERKLRYTNYIGDGDSKAYTSISDNKPYGESVKIYKLDCVGHIQKRVGTQLRNLKKLSGSKKLLDGKTVGGKGRLSLKEIDRLQIYYGLAIRRNVGNIRKMKQDIDAILRHRLSTDENPNHSLCPEGESTWCNYKKKQQDYKHKNPLPKAVAVHIKPIFDRLSTEDLLKRCVDGYTQNAAESFNNLLWHFAPKSTFLGQLPMGIACNIAVCVYNDGYQSLMTLFEKVGVNIGAFAKAVLRERDTNRIYLAKRNNEDMQKKIRQAHRKRRLALEDKKIEEEGTVYESGAF